jgi:hypothetical protein
MKSIMNNEKKLAGILTVLFFLTLSSSIYFYSNKRITGRHLDQEKLKSEALLSEKLSLDKEIIKFKSETEALKGTNAKLDKLILKSNKELSDKTAAIHHLMKSKYNEKELRNKLADARKSVESLQRMIDNMNKDLNRLQSENDILTRELAVVREENNQLVLNVKTHNENSADNYRVESQKRRNDRITAYAKLTRKLSVSFDVLPQVPIDVHFKIITPSGKVITDESKELTWDYVESDNLMLASTNGIEGDFEVTKRIQMLYHPKEKMARGVYKIEVLNKDNRMGGCQIRLK